MKKNSIFKKVFLFTLITILVLSLAGCNSKPKNVRKEIYDKSVEYANILQEAYNNHVDLYITKTEEIPNFISDSFEKEDLTEEEKEILNKLLDSTGSYLFYMIDNNDKESLKDFEQSIKELKELLQID